MEGGTEQFVRAPHLLGASSQPTGRKKYRARVITRCVEENSYEGHKEKSGFRKGLEPVGKENEL